MMTYVQQALRCGLGLLAVAAFAGTACAQPTAAQQSALKANCRSDFMANCSSVRPGGKEALQCLQANVGKLSPACQSAVRATMPPEPVKAAAPPAAPAASATAPAASAPVSAPAATVTAVPSPPPAPPVKKPMKQPAAASAAPAHAAPAPAPAAPPTAEPTSSGRPGGLVPGAALVTKACARYLVMHCRGVQPGGGREVACLTDYVNAGHFVGPRCRAALQVTGRLR
jgi:hypothetical protein